MQNNSRALDCAILTSEDDVVAIEHEWRGLYERVGKGVFTNYDWFIIWWRTLGNIRGRTLHVVTVSCPPIIGPRNKLGFRG